MSLHRHFNARQTLAAKKLNPLFTFIEFSTMPGSAQPQLIRNALYW
jgi:hypothetical protein